MPSEVRRLRSSSRACISALTKKLFISSTRCSCEIPLIDAPLRTVTFSVFACEKRGFPELADDFAGVSHDGSAGADCLVFTAVKPIGGDREVAGMPLVFAEVPLASSANAAGLSERTGPFLPSSASLRLIMAAFRFLRRWFNWRARPDTAIR